MATSNRAALAACSRLAAVQHGVIGMAQASAAGVSRHAVTRLIRSDSWRRVRPGVFALWVPAAAEGRRRQRLSSAALWMGDGSAVSYRAAALVWKLDGVKSAPLEFSTTGSFRSTEPGLVVHRVGSLPVEDIARRDGIPVTTAARTLTDLASVLDAASLELALESAFRMGLVRPRDVREALHRAGRTHKGRGMMRFLLDQSPSRATESALEVLAWRLVRVHRLPRPVRQFDVLDEVGAFVARVDLAYPEAKVVVEAEGNEFHSTATQLRRDRRRQNELMRLGWRVYRASWEDVTRRGETTAAEIAELLAARLPGFARSREAWLITSAERSV